MGAVVSASGRESWSTIGAVLGMSKQGAQDWYNRRSIPELQDHTHAE